MNSYPPLSFSFSTLGWPQATWTEAAALARYWGFAGVELRALHGRLNLPSALSEEFQTPQNMAALVAKSGVRVTAMNSSLKLLDPTPADWEEITQLAAWADALGVPYLRVFDGPEKEDGPTLLDGIARWSTLRRQRDFRCDLMIETHSSLLDARQCQSLGQELEAAGFSLNLLWDSFHTWKHHGAQPAEDWEILKPWVRHIHLKDGVSAPEVPSGLRYELPGEGDFPARPLLEALRRDRFTGPVSLEWERLWHPELPRLEEALTSGRRHGWW